MKAIRLHTYGGAENLHYEDAPKPVIKENEVLIKVYATSVNHLEIKMASGDKKESMPLTFPWIPGCDYAGKIVEMGRNVTGFEIGDEVYGKRTGGTYAAYLAEAVENIARKPKNLTLAEASSVPHVGLTAWQAMFEHGDLQEGQKVLIHGGAGAVGTYAIQFAKNKGAFVYATASEADIHFLHTLNVDVAIDYKKEDFAQVVKEVDLVLDVLGGDTQIKSFGILKPGGRLVNTTGKIDESVKQYDINAEYMVVHPDGKTLASITQLIEAGKIVTDVAQIYPIEKTADAWNVFTGKTPSSKKFTHGKIILQVDDFE